MILYSNSYQEIADYPIIIVCPHCNAKTSLTLVTPPLYHVLARYKPEKVGMVYRCNACNAPVFLRFPVIRYDLNQSKLDISKQYDEVEYSQETFEFNYIPQPVQDDFKEALQCYSIGCYNAFGSMCRRVIQSSASALGAKGKDKVQYQIQDLKELTSMDDDTYNIIKQIVIDGHDGAHPHLPTLTSDRAAILLELIKDVMYQLFVRKAKLEESAALRKANI